MTPKHFLPDIHLDIIHAFFGFLGGVNSDLINGRYKYKVESFWDVQYLKKSSSGFPVWRSCNWHDSLLWWDWVHRLFIHFVLYSKMKKRWIKIFNFLSITISTITSLGMWGMNASDAEAFKESPYTLVLTLKVEENECHLTFMKIRNVCQDADLLFFSKHISPPLLTGRRHGGDGWIPYWGWVKRFLCTFSLLGSINNQDLIQLKVMTRSCWI